MFSSYERDLRDDARAEAKAARIRAAQASAPRAWEVRARFAELYQGKTHQELLSFFGGDDALASWERLYREIQNLSLAGIEIDESTAALALKTLEG